jgi:PIN like domain
MDGSARFFVDENELALARSLAAARRDVVFPGSTRLPEVPLGMLDHKWLPVVGEMGLVVITRDKRIRYRPVEAAALIRPGVRAFVLAGSGAINTWQTLTLVVRQWDAIERHMVEHQSGPWLASITQSGIKTLAMPS